MLVAQKIKTGWNANRSRIIFNWMLLFLTAFSCLFIVWVGQGLLFKFLEIKAAVYNSQSVSLTALIVVILAALVLSTINSKRFVSVSLGVFVGAVSANILWRLLIGPVPDYVYVPFTQDLYCNAADITIIISAIALIVGLKEIF